MASYHVVRSNHPEDDALGRVFGPGEQIPDLDVDDEYNKQKIEAGVFYPVDSGNAGSAPDAGSAGPEATDAATRLAQENNIDLSDVNGTGKGGRITDKDVQAVIDAEEDGDNDENKEGES